MRKLLRKVRTPRVFFLLLLICSTAVRVFLSVFPKTAVTYFDELVYLELAQNIWRKGLLTVCTAQVHFTKMLYPLLLSPFYLIRDGMARTTAISAFNAALISSALIPGYLLAKRILKKDWQINLSVLLLALSPNALFSVTFMAENLYFPLLLWGIYLAYRTFTDETPAVRNSLLLGFLTFLLYLTKEVGAAFLAAAAAGYAVILAKGEKKHRGKLFPGAIAFLGAFLVPFLTVRFTVLNSAGYTYAEQVSFSNLQTPSQLMYLLYATGMLLLFFLLSCGYFPIALPLSRRKALPAPEKRLLLFSAVYAGCVTLGTAFGVSLADDYADPNLRIHLRYYLGAAFPFLLLYLQLQDAEDLLPKKEKLLPHALAFGVLLLIFAGIPGYGSLVDFPVFHITHLLGDRIRHLILWKGAAIGFIALFLLLWKLKGLKKSTLLLLCAALVLEAASCAAFLRQARREEMITADAPVAEAKKIDQALDALPGSVLVVADNPYVPELRLLNTLSDDDYAVTTQSGLKEVCRETGSGRIDLAEPCVPSPIDYLMADQPYSLSSADTVLTVGDFARLDREAYEDITPEGVTAYRLYRAKDASAVTLLDPMLCPVGVPITFFQPDPSARDYQPTGFSVTEARFTWSLDNESTLTLKPQGDAAPLTVSWKVAQTIGEQSCQVYAGETLLWEGVLAGPGEITFTLPAEARNEDGTVTLRFLFPDAAQPGNGDPRVLAAAFESITLLPSE